MGRLHLLLGDLLLRHYCHPGRDGAGDSLLGHIVVVDDGEEPATAPGPLGGVVAVYPGWHAASLLQGKGGERDNPSARQCARARDRRPGHHTV